MKGKNSTVRILLLEDDIEVVALLAWSFIALEKKLQEMGSDLSLVVLSEYSMVEDYINPDKKHEYDIVLLDRDCKMGGSFHALDFGKFDLDHIISISQIPQWNKEARKRGVTRVAQKDHEYITEFTAKVLEHIKDILDIHGSLVETEPAEDPLYEPAVSVVREAGKASADMLQRTLKIGYARSARLLDMMEDEGVIGPAEGNEPRKIL